MLIATVMPIAKAKAAGFAQVRISDEDLVQEGMLGFLEAVKKFDRPRAYRSRPTPRSVSRTA